MDDAAEARLRRVVILIKTERLRAADLLAPLLKQTSESTVSSLRVVSQDGLPQNQHLSLELLKVAASQHEPSSQFALAKRLMENCSNECLKIMEAITLLRRHRAQI